jgi:hypothetical protein
MMVAHDGGTTVSHGQRKLPAGHPTLRLLPIRPIRARWPRWLEQRLGAYFRADPAVILDDAAAPDDFRAAMAVLRVGETFKITSADRHPESDSVLLDNVDLSGAHIVDIGASDGSTSLDLIRRIPNFGSYVIADRYLNVYGARSLGHTLLFDSDGQCILIFGRRCIAWPRLSRAVRWLYAPMIAATSRNPERRTEIPLLNPTVRAAMKTDSRITCAVHDVFTPWSGQSPDVIKVANLLRRVYFDDKTIRCGLDALLATLPEGGHLFIVDDPYIAGINSRAGLYRREADHFVAIAMTKETPEINDLILAHDPGRLVGKQEMS